MSYYIPSTSRAGQGVSICALFFHLFAPAPSYAQSPSAALDTLVVYGSRVPTTADQPRAVTTISAETIETRNDRDVLDLLSEVPGVHVNLPGSRGNVGEVFLRGGEPNFTAVYVDGIQVNDPTNTRGGSFDFSTLNIDDIEQIEIQRGPSSSIYGSDALSGVINIVTRGGTAELTGSLNVEVGDRDYRRGGFRLSGPISESSGFSVGATAVGDGDQRSADRFDGESITAKLDLGQDKRTRTSIYARRATSDARGFPESSGGPLFAELRDHTSRNTDDSALGLALVSDVSANTSLHLSAATYDHQERVFSPAIAPGVGGSLPANSSSSDFARQTLNMFLRTKLAEAIDMAFGVSYQNEDGDSTGEIEFSPQFLLPTAYAISRNDRSAYAEIAIQPSNRLNLTASLRTDDPESSRRETTGNLGLAYDFLDERARIRLGWGNAFKLPSLFALADPLVGNFQLRPETVDSWEIGLDVASLGGTLTWQITAFKQRFDDLIDFDFETFRTVNRSRVNARGVELSSEFTANDQLSVTFHATRTDTDVLSAAVNLRQRPDLRAGIGALWKVSDVVTAHAGWQYIGRRFDSAIPTGERELPSYSRVDVAVTWYLKSAIQINVALDNIADASYEEAIGFPAVGRQLRVSLEKTFGRGSR
jgi:vitamin B12 transporter